MSGQLPAETMRTRARDLREWGGAKGAAYPASRIGQRGDGVVSGHGAGKIEAVTQDYLTVYLDTERWDGRPRLEVKVKLPFHAAIIRTTAARRTSLTSE